MGTEAYLSWHGMQGLDTQYFNLDLQLLSLCYVDMHSRYLQYYHACMFRSVCGMFKRLCPSLVALVCTWAAKLISCTNNEVLITLGGPFYGSFAA